MAARALGGVLVLALVAVWSGGAAAEERHWGWLGVRIRDLSEQEMNDISLRHGIREGFGAVIVEVMKETPAAASGLETGDIVVGFRGRPVVDTRTLQRLVAKAGVGQRVSLTVLRRGEGRRGLEVRLGPMPDEIVADRVAAEFGFLVREPGSPPELGGAPPSVVPTVAAVVPGSRAERAGLRPGDVLVEVNGRPVVSVDAVREVLREQPLDRALGLVVRRGDEAVPVTVPPAEIL